MTPISSEDVAGSGLTALDIAHQEGAEAGSVPEAVVVGVKGAP